MSSNSAALGKHARSTSVDATAAAETSHRREDSQVPAAGDSSPETSGARAGGFKRAKTAHITPSSPVPAPAAATAAAGTTEPPLASFWTGGWAQFAPRRESRVFLRPYGASARAAASGGMWGAAGSAWEEPTPEPSAQGTPTTPLGQGGVLSPFARPAARRHFAAASLEVGSSVAPSAGPTSPRLSVAATLLPRACSPSFPPCSPNWASSDDENEDEDENKGPFPARSNNSSAALRAAIAPTLLAALHDELHPQGGVVATHQQPHPVACDHPPPYDECIATLPPGSGPDVVVHKRTTTFCARTREHHSGMLRQYDIVAAMSAPRTTGRERSWSEGSDVSPFAVRPQQEEEEEEVEEEEKGEVEEAEEAGGEESKKDSYGLSPGILNWRQESPWPYEKYARELELTEEERNEVRKKLEAKWAAEKEESEEEEKFVPWVCPSPWPYARYARELEQSDEKGAVPPWGVLSPYEPKIWHDLGEGEEGGVGPSTSTPEEKKAEENEETGDEDWFPFKLPSPWPGYREENVEGRSGVAPFYLSGRDGCREDMYEYE